MRPDIRYTPRPQWSTDDVTEVGLVELVYEENNQSLQATLLISFLDRTSDFSELYTANMNGRKTVNQAS